MTSVSHSPDGPSQSGRRPSLGSLGRQLLWLVFAFLAVATTLVPSPTYAAVSVSVQAQPISEPIDALVTVTDASGKPITSLTAGDFTVSVDGTGITTTPTPPQNLAVSVVFAMDYSPSVVDTALVPMQKAVITFINAMQPGDYAAIVKFNGGSGAKVVQAFTQIDGAAGTAALINAVNADYPGRESNVLDAALLSVQQLVSPPTPLPLGPKAIVLVSDGADNASSAEFAAVVQSANDAKISIFTVGVGDLTADPTSQPLLTGLAEQTGGTFYPAPTDAQIGNAYVQVSKLLANAYLLSFQSAITDCNTHTLQVQVTGQTQPGTATFTRCTPLSAPDVRGLTLAAATTKLNSLGLVPGRLPDQASTTVPAGSVVSQAPTVGTIVLPGSTVNLVVSSGTPTVPNVVGMTQSAAEDLIKNAGVTPVVTQAYSSSVPAGDVISVGAAYELPAGGAAVDLVVSAGPLAGGGGGGGGATGPFELAIGLLFVAVVAAARRRKV
jgi:VWFA-related protein